LSVISWSIKCDVVVVAIEYYFITLFKWILLTFVNSSQSCILIVYQICCC